MKKLILLVIFLIFLLPSLLLDRLYPIDTNENGSIGLSSPLVLRNKGVFLYNEVFLGSTSILHKKGNVLANKYDKREVVDTFTGEISAYASLDLKAQEGECYSGNPRITASGDSVGRGIVAANFLEFGTKIRIPEYFGDEVFIVKDRMASDYGWGNLDVWMKDREDAEKFGRKITKVEIIE